MSRPLESSERVPTPNGAGLPSSANPADLPLSPGGSGGSTTVGTGSAAGTGSGPGGPAGGAAAGANATATGAGGPFRRPIPPKLYRISEVAEYARTSRQTIHNYTTMGLIQESQWTQGGHRLYDETVFPRLDEILLMKAQRRTLKDIRESFLGRPDRRA